MTTFQNILVPTDFGDASEQAISYATSLAQELDAKLTLLHVHEPPTTHPYGEALAWPIEDFAQGAKIWLDDATSTLKRKYPRTESVMETGRPADRILAAAKARKADLIVMGTHGRRGLAHVFFGSVAEKVVRRSPVPVLTVGPRASEADG